METKTVTVDRSVKDHPPRPVRVPRILLWLLALLAVYKLVYHCLYLGGSAFALATFSDGRVYEDAARDILAHPPLGSKPFYLQGLYAYFMALPLSIRPIPAAALVFQLLLAAFGFWMFHRAARSAWGSLTGSLCTVLLLAYPTLTFYENKYLSAELGVACNIAVLFAFGCYARHPAGRGALALGAACSLSLLARPNMLLALPATLVAVALVRGAATRGFARDAAAFILGALLMISPMALRNQLVTGRADIFPTHGGGTSFYIGNNPYANGLWNTAGGLFSGQVGVERFELTERIGVDAAGRAEQARAIGDALFRRGMQYIADHPRKWLALQARKVWYVSGNDEIAQDYDLFGEREIVHGIFRTGLPFGFLLALGVSGFLFLLGAARRREGVGPPRDRDADSVPAGARPAKDTPAVTRHLGAWLWVAGGQFFAVLVANLAFFTSAQHRLPMAVPLAFLSGPLLAATAEAVRSRKIWREPAASGISRRSWVFFTVFVLLLGQSFWARSSRTRPSTAHYYNLAVVQHTVGDMAGAIETLNIALQRRPGQPEFLLDRARLARELGRFDQAQTDLTALTEMSDLPGWLLRRVAHEQALLIAERRRASKNARN